MGKQSPMSLSLALLRSEGWSIGPREHFNTFSKRKEDLYGAFDIEAMSDDDTIYVQTTTCDHLAERKAKIEAAPITARLLKNPTRIIEAHGWDTRRPEAGPCKKCGGGCQPWSGLPDAESMAFGRRIDGKKCPACRGTGKGPRPRTQLVWLARWRLSAYGEWVESPRRRSCVLGHPRRKAPASS